MQLDWAVNEHTVLRPDIAISCNDTADYITTLPALVIEISTPYTAYLDRKIKYDIYEEEGVPYYIIVNPETAKYHTYALKNGKYVEEPAIMEFQITEGCTINIDVAKVLRELA